MKPLQFSGLNFLNTVGLTSEQANDLDTVLKTAVINGANQGLTVTAMRYNNNEGADQFTPIDTNYPGYSPDRYEGTVLVSTGKSGFFNNVDGLFYTFMQGIKVSNIEKFWHNINLSPLDLSTTKLTGLKNIGWYKQLQKFVGQPQDPA